VNPLARLYLAMALLATTAVCMGLASRLLPA